LADLDFESNMYHIKAKTGIKSILLTGLWQPYLNIDWDLSVYNDYTDIEELIPNKIPISWRVALRLRRTFMTSYYVLLCVWENGIMCPIRLPEPVVHNTQPSFNPNLEMWPEVTAPLRPPAAIATTRGL